MVGCGASAESPARSSGAAARPAAVVDRFDAPAAVRLMRLQVRYGQRPGGSPQLRALARRLRPLLPNGRFEAIPGEPRLRNIVGTIPGRGRAIVLGAHYDTLAKPKGFVGANNGAAGTAIVIEVARAVARMPRAKSAPPIKVVLFDGEEPAEGLPAEQADFYNSGLRGSRAYVARHGGATKAMVLLDYVANKGLRLPREGSSTPALWARLRAAAERVGKGRFFPPETGTTIIDDHTPFLGAGIPAVDLIDWSYEGQSLSDGMDKISLAATDAVGESVTDLLLALGRG